MTTAYTSLLGFALPVTGELSGTWGDTVNNGITSLLDSAIAGTTTLSADSDVTLTTTQGSSNTAREAILLWTAGGTATRTITAPAQSKIYTVINASSGTQSIILAGVGPTTGVTIAKGESALVAWNGSDFIKISNTAGPGTFTNLTVTGNTSLGDADTDTITQAASYVTGTQLKSAKTATNTLSLAAYDVDGTAYTNLITLTASNTPTLALTSTGVGTINNMSIGATTASTGAFTTLSATGVTTVQAGTAAAPAITTTGDTNTGIWFPAADTIAFTEGGVESMRIDASGNLGLGVTPSAWGAPTFQVGRTSVYGSGAFTAFASNWFSDTGDKYIASDFATQYYQLNGQHVWRTAPSGTAGAGISFIQAMTLDASGNLGIGVTTPKIELQTKSSGGIQATNSGEIALRYNAYYDGADRYIQAANKASSIVLDSNGSILFYNTNTASSSANSTITGWGERARIDSSGNLGLGVTPSAWQTGANLKALQVGVGAAFFSDTNSAYLGQNVFQDSAGTSKYISTNFASKYQQTSSVHSWYTAASGTAGNAITFTQAMTLDASGNLLVGDTSVIGSGKTNVYFNGASAQGMNLKTTYADVGSGFLGFYNSSGSNIGSVTQSTGSAVLYNTTSDQRLKKNIQDAESASLLIDSLQVRQFDWESDNSHQRYGFVAQELVTVAPEAVYQPIDKDAMMAVDYSKLVPMLVKEIQSLRKRLATAGI